MFDHTFINIVIVVLAKKKKKPNLDFGVAQHKPHVSMDI